MRGVERLFLTTRGFSIGKKHAERSSKSPFKLLRYNPYWEHTRSIVEGSEEVYYVTSDPTSSHEGSFSDSTTLCDLLFGSVPILSTPLARIKTSNKRPSKLLWDPYLQASYFFITVLFKRG